MQVPETHYAPSGEIKIAYQVHGSGEHDLLFSGGSASNIETVWSLVSRTVRDLVVGSELRFADRGEHELKGIEEPWHLYVLE